MFHTIPFRTNLVTFRRIFHATAGLPLVIGMTELLKQFRRLNDSRPRYLNIIFGYDMNTSLFDRRYSWQPPPVFFQLPALISAELTPHVSLDNNVRVSCNNRF